jgi:hypothetical protein
VSFLPRLAEELQELRMTQSTPRPDELAPVIELAYGWCAPCQKCHVAPFCPPTAAVNDDEEAA